MTASGPLSGVRVVEMEAIGPVPYCGMVLADMGAEVIRLGRPTPSDNGISVPPQYDVPARGKLSIALNLKHPEGLAAARRLIASSAVLIEGFRPGVMERLGLGPDTCLAANSQLVFGRVSGWGSSGPLAPWAGHDLNFLALSGALGAMGQPSCPPPVPLNLIGDYGGGAMHLACGVLAALVAARAPGGKGQVVETSILQGATSLTALQHGLMAAGQWSATRADNFLDGGAPFYRCYETADGGFVAVGAIEGKFYERLLEGLDLKGDLTAEAQMDRSAWPKIGSMFSAKFRLRTRDEWSAIFAESDACVTPILSLSEAPTHSQQRAVGGFFEVGGVRQPRAGVVFSAESAAPQPPRRAGTDTASVLGTIGYDLPAIEALRHAGALSRAPASAMDASARA